MGSGCGAAATGFKGGHSRPAGGAAGRGAGATPTMAPSAGFEDAAPAAGSGHTAPLSGRSDVQKGRMTATEHPHAAYDDAQEDATAEITEDFDLRRAVIYSEILKPKFDE